MRKILAVAAAATLLTFAWTASAHASTSSNNGGNPATIVLSAGSLTISGGAPGGFGTHILQGTDQTYNSTIGNLSVVDALGDGTGWYITASTGQATLKSGSNALGALTIAAPNNPTCVASNTCDSPSWTTNGGTLSSADVTSVTSGHGNAAGGSYTVGFPTTALTVAVPANTLAGTYTATLTFTVTSAP